MTPTRKEKENLWKITRNMHQTASFFGPSFSPSFPGSNQAGDATPAPSTAVGELWVWGWGPPSWSHAAPFTDPFCPRCLLRDIYYFWKVALDLQVFLAGPEWNRVSAVGVVGGCAHAGCFCSRVQEVFVLLFSFPLDVPCWEDTLTHAAPRSPLLLFGCY